MFVPVTADVAYREPGGRSRSLERTTEQSKEPETIRHLSDLNWSDASAEG